MTRIGSRQAVKRIVKEIYKVRILHILLLLLFFIVSSAIGQTLTAAQRLEAWEKGVASRARATGTSEGSGVIGVIGFGSEASINHAPKTLPKSKFDATLYRAFLKMNRSGSVRLFDSNKLRLKLESNGKGQNSLFETYVPGEGVSYSIRKKRYTHRVLSDFTLTGASLFFAGALNQSLVTDLGDVEPGSVDLNNPAVREILAFKPSTTIEMVLKNEEEIENGIRIGERVWTKSVVAQMNSTFLARVIAYDKSYDKKSSRPLDAMIHMDERRDFTFVFRIVAIEDDGGVTLIWRELFRDKSPKLDL